MKINILLPCFGSRPLGGFRIAYQYANGLAERGHQVALTYASGREGKWYGRALFCAMRVAIAFIPDWFALDRRIARRYVFALGSRSIPDADASVATAWDTAVALEACPPSKGKKVYLIQDYETWSASPEAVQATWRYADMQKIVISHWLYNLGLQFGASSMRIVPNAVDPKLFHLSNTGERKYAVAMMHSPLPKKGGEDGIRALQIAKEECPELTAVLFGTRARSPQIPAWVDYVQNPAQSDLAALYNNALAYLCPSHTEGWGLPPMEAMACGAAVVSTRNGGVEDFCVDGETALLVPVGDSQEMARQLVRLVRDEPLRERLAQNGLQKIKEFSFEASLDAVEQVLGA
jgi:glycosyltransferase involved in cell wall biosynthesis